jgi:hypothetical protein
LTFTCSKGKQRPLSLPLRFLYPLLPDLSPATRPPFKQLYQDIGWARQYNMDASAHDSKRKLVVGDFEFEFTAIEPVSKKPKHSQPLSRVSEQRFWSLPVEFKDKIAANVMLLSFFQMTKTDFT